MVELFGVELPRLFFRVTLGEVITWAVVIAAACKVAMSMRKVFLDTIFELHDGIMLHEERKIDNREETIFRRIVHKVEDQRKEDES